MALARWAHPQLGQISPADFIPVAERAGLVHGLTRTLLRKALVEAAGWPEAVGLSFNLSMHDLGSSEELARLLELIEDLLEMTTLSVGAAGVQVGDFDPWEPVAELAAESHELREGVTLRFDPPATGSPLMHGDRRRIVRILGILLNNAIKFTEQGEITVSLQVRNDRVAWRVQDTGIGIPAEAQRVVFDEFRQADGSVTRRYSGSGIGLALARRMARLLGGDIDLYSVPGEGSTFTLELPLHCETTTTVHADT